MKVKEWCEKEGISLADLARRAKIPLSLFYQIINGHRTMNPGYAKAIVKVTKGACTFDEMTRKPEKKHCPTCGKVMG